MRGAASGPVCATPIASPETTSCTRRFCARPCSRGVIRHRLRLAIAGSGDIVWLDALRDQEIPDCIGAVLRQLLVELVASDAVRIALDLQLQTGIGLQNSRDLRQADLRYSVFSVYLPVSNSTSDILTISPRADSLVASTLLSCARSFSRTALASRALLFAAAARA